MRTYLDHNATSPLRPEALDAMTDALRHVGNASSLHTEGRAARARIEAARRAIATLVDGRPEDLIFTSGATEANNTVLTSFAGQRVLISAIEHPSVRAALPHAELIPVTPDGVLDLPALERLIATGPAPALISVMLVNNETGIIQPVREVALLAKRAGALVHTDAVQAAGRIPVSMIGLGVDSLTLSAHKIGGPQGVGALLRAPGSPLTPMLRGGGQESRLRAGTEPVAAISGFGAAALAAARETDSRAAQLSAWRDRLEASAKDRIPQATLYGTTAPRIASTALIGLPGIKAETQLMALDLAGIAVSSGAACSSGVVQSSPVLRAMGVAEDEAACALRVSLGWSSVEEDIDAFLSAWSNMALRILTRHTATEHR